MCAQYGSIFNGPSLFTLLSLPTRLSQPLPPPWVPSFTVAPATPCFPWRENNESEAQLITFLTCFRTLYAKPDWEKYLHIQRWKMRQGIRTHQERKKKKAMEQNKTSLLTFRTESKLLALAFEALWDLAVPDLFSLTSLQPHALPSLLHMDGTAQSPRWSTAASLHVLGLPFSCYPLFKEGPPPPGSPPTPLASWITLCFLLSLCQSYCAASESASPPGLWVPWGQDQVWPTLCPQGSAQGQAHMRSPGMFAVSLRGFLGVTNNGDACRTGGLMA